MTNLHKSHQDLVEDFMIIMEQHSKDAPKVDVTQLTVDDVKVAKLRLKLIVEELSEMFDAFLSKNSFESKVAPLFSTVQSVIESLNSDEFEINRTEVLDAIVDQDYINSGTGVWLNLPLEEAFQEVHTNNLTKVDPITKKVIKRPDGKVVKPASYVPVDLSEVLQRHDSK